MEEFHFVLHLFLFFDVFVDGLLEVVVEVAEGDGSDACFIVLDTCEAHEQAREP